MIFFIVLLVGSFIFYYFTGNIMLMGMILGIGLLIILWGGQMMLTSSYHEVEQANGNIEDGFQKRHDVLIKVLDTVKSEMKKRDESLEKVLIISDEKRSAPKGLLGQPTQGDYEKWYQQTRHEVIRYIREHDEMNQDSHRLLIQSVNEVEENLSAARRFYNHAAKKFNSNLHSFPGNIIGKFKGYEESPYFKVENEAVKADVKIEF